MNRLERLTIDACLYTDAHRIASLRCGSLPHLSHCKICSISFVRAAVRHCVRASLLLTGARKG
jgi:hypothetical protein